MNFDKPFDLLVECRGCGIENLLPGFTAATPAICNQCRERLLDPQISNTYQELVCEQCGMLLLLSKDAPILSGESVCRCGSTQFLRHAAPTLPEWVARHAAPDDDADGEDDFDWCRPAGGQDDLNDYNDLFDKDPSH